MNTIVQKNQKIDRKNSKTRWSKLLLILMIIALGLFSQVQAGGNRANENQGTPILVQTQSKSESKASGSKLIRWIKDVILPIITGGQSNDPPTHHPGGGGTGSGSGGGGP